MVQPPSCAGKRRRRHGASELPARTARRPGLVWDSGRRVGSCGVSSKFMGMDGARRKKRLARSTSLDVLTATKGRRPDGEGGPLRVVPTSDRIKGDSLSPATLAICLAEPNPLGHATDENLNLRQIRSSPEVVDQAPVRHRFQPVDLHLPRVGSRYSQSSLGRRFDRNGSIARLHVCCDRALDTTKVEFHMAI